MLLVYCFTWKFDLDHSHNAISILDGVSSKCKSIENFVAGISAIPKKETLVTVRNNIVNLVKHLKTFELLLNRFD